MMACPQFDPRVLLNSSSTPSNGVILFFGNRGAFRVAGPVIFGGKVHLDLFLDERRVPTKFGCTSFCDVQMHEEQTNILL